LTFPSVDLSFWAGLGGLPATPGKLVKIMDNAVKEDLNDPDVISKLDQTEGVPAYPTGEVYGTFVPNERIPLEKCLTGLKKDQARRGQEKNR